MPLEPLEPAEETAAPAAAALPTEDDGSLFILPPSDRSEATDPPAADLQWRVPEPSSPVETDFAFQVQEPVETPLEPPQYTPPSEPAKQTAKDDDDFEKFLKSLDDE
jgi:hypothetical protein